MNSRVGLPQNDSAPAILTIHRLNPILVRLPARRCAKPARKAAVAAAFLALMIPFSLAAMRPAVPRQAISLDGQWQVEEGSTDSVPGAYGHSIPVPGLLDMAQPAFVDVGLKSPRREAFWYRRSFKLDGPIPDVAVLKISKAQYGTRVILNGSIAGEHLPCFTPAYLDVKRFLKGSGQVNELVIRVGAGREALPPGMPTGWDFEKYRYIPGIYDSVELILTGKPYIANIQVVPDLFAKSVRLVAELQGTEGLVALHVRANVTEVTTGKQVGALKEAGTTGKTRLAGGATLLDITIPIANCRFWSPEDPFLYQLTLSTGKDAAKVRFGMRSFRFEPGSKAALLNGRTYYMRGSNVTIYRFFEDSERLDRPWRADWVRRLHRKFKSMHWNSLRYCIGFPPEIWYDIADEEGFLIQDEFPIWLLSKAPENPVAEKIIPEYREWMRERWNHPSVAIWDAQNESHTAETGKAIQAVRRLDLSNRPWENGWAEPQEPTDCTESHPYEFQRTYDGKSSFRMKEIADWSGVPGLGAAQKKLQVPIIINEYAWLWLTRDGEPTSLTGKVYADLLGPASTAEDRRAIYARYLAALTEFWRAHREAAGVLHFCALGYSRSGDKPRPEGGATSDHFVDMEKLTFEPHFEEQVGNAFNPLGIMLDLWAEEIPPGNERPLKVYVINDLYSDWSGEVKLTLIQRGRATPVASRTFSVKALGREVLEFNYKFPAEPGAYSLTAELKDNSRKTVRSIREFKILPGK